MCVFDNELTPARLQGTGMQFGQGSRERLTLKDRVRERRVTGILLTLCTVPAA